MSELNLNYLKKEFLKLLLAFYIYVSSFAAVNAYLWFIKSISVNYIEENVSQLVHLALWYFIPMSVIAQFVSGYILFKFYDYSSSLLVYLWRKQK